MSFRLASIVLLITLSNACSATPQDKPKTVEVASEIAWPRTHEKDGHQVVVYDPQVEEWKRQRELVARSAFVLTTKNSKEPVYGALDFTVKTEVSTASREVRLSDRKITSIRFPNVSGTKSKAYESIVRQVLGASREWRVSLDFILAYLAASQERAKPVKVGHTPPPIFHSPTPAILVMFLGDPRFEAIRGTGLEFATNTNWDLLLDKAARRYYLLNEKHWLTTEDVERGPWTVAHTLPADLFRLPGDKNWELVRANLPGERVRSAPRVFVSKTPSELIITDGAPRYRGIPGTRLSQVSNTSSDLFRDGLRGSFYFLTAGRWFRAPSLKGPWEAASQDLPKDFARIPSDDPAASVRASVPGTVEAEDAILLATVPCKATVDRKTVTVKVVYDGDPQFVVVDGAPKVYFAVNSRYDVFRVSGRYYCCYNGVWFVSSSATGPFAVCVDVPEEIYAIPSTHPKHKVTYVYVYDVTPTTVVCGYTAGYVGVYVTTGVVCFGLGWAMYYDHWHHHHHYYHYHYHPHYYGYGCAARYDYHHGTYYRSAHAYGPYGGAGRGAAYNPTTGTYARGAYAYGPYGSRYAAQAYNPTTGTYAARRGGSDAYGSWGQGVVANGDKWARGGYVSDSRGTAGGVRTSEGGGAVGVRKSDGGSAVVGRDRHGDVYVGKDGNIYRRDGKNSWQKREGGAWSNYDVPSPSSSGARSGTSGGTGRTGRSPSVNSRLQQDARARSRSSASSSRATRFSGGGRGGVRTGSRGGGGLRRR